MVKGLASLRDLRIECYEPYQALDMQRYVRLSLFLVVFVSLWDLCVTRSFEKKYLMAPFSWGFASKLCDYARSAFPSLYERFTKKQQPQQPQPELNSIEMI